MIRLFLLGSGIAASRSPLLHEAALQARGLVAEYTLLDLPAERLAEELPRQLADPWLRGFNVTVPYKRRIMEWLDGISVEAQRCGAVNCVYRRENAWLGTNTDLAGFRSALETAAPPAAFEAGIIGAGGAARAVLVVLSTFPGCRGIRVWNRDEIRGREMLLQAGPCSGSAPQQVERLEDLAGCNLLVQATSSPDLMLPPSVLACRPLFIDLMYGPAARPRRQSLETAGLRCLDGGTMLIAQAAASFQFWFAGESPLDEMTRAYYNQDMDPSP